jgi:hypothetical protein
MAVDHFKTRKSTKMNRDSRKTRDLGISMKTLLNYKG